MKRNRIGRALLATMISLALGLGVTACSRDYTVAFVYATSAQTGGVSAFAVDYQTGSLVQIAGSPFTSNLLNPVSVVATHSGKFLYVIGGSQDNKVAEMSIGTDGKLYGQKTYDISGSSPTSAAVDPSGSFLYVTFTYQKGYGTGTPGPGGVDIFPINNNATDANYGALGTRLTLNVGNNPVSVVVSPLTHFVYVLDADTNTSGIGQGQLLAFSQDPTSGTLTPLLGTTISTVAGKTVATGVAAGTSPTAIAEDATSRFIFVTDRSSSQLYGYTVQNAPAAGIPVRMTYSPFPTGQYPVALTIDPRGKFMYTANYGANTVSGFAIDPASGNPSAVTGTNATVATGPTCVSIEPALGLYLYTSNRLDGSVSGAKLDSHTGALTGIESTPFQASAQLSCVVAVANGEHSESLVTP